MLCEGWLVHLKKKQTAVGATGWLLLLFRLYLPIELNSSSQWDYGSNLDRIPKNGQFSGFF